MSVDKKHLALVKKWISRLGLTEWRIKFVDNCAPEDMMLADSCGCTEFQESTRTARVQILDEKYWGNRIIPYDYEEILVHELLHLKTCFLTDTDDALQERIGHQLIDDLARAFVAAQRDKGE